MKNKQTAVEWLYELSKKREPDKFDLEQAKEMEKEQIIDAAKWLPKPFETIEFIKELGEQYYNEQFKNK